MTPNEFETYACDRQQAEKLFKEQGSTPTLARTFREISKRKWDAEMYNIPYVSVFKEEN